jgi:hypothetical protein
MRTIHTASGITLSLDFSQARDGHYPEQDPCRGHKEQHSVPGGVVLIPALVEAVQQKASNGGRDAQLQA